MATESLIKPVDQQAKAPLKKSTVIGIAALVIGLFLFGLLFMGEKKPPPSQQQRPTEGQASSIGNPRTIEMELRAAGEKTGIKPDIPATSSPTDPTPLPQQPKFAPVAEASSSSVPTAAAASAPTAGVVTPSSARTAMTGAPSSAATPPGPLPTDMVPPNARRSSDAMAAGGQRITGSNSGAMSPEESLARSATAKALLFDDTTLPKADPMLTRVSDSNAVAPEQPIALASTSTRSRDDRYNDPTYKALLEKERKAAEAMQQFANGSRSASPDETNRNWMREMEGAPPIQGGIKPSQIPTRWVLAQGNVIPAILGRNLNSDLPGEVVATVSTNVYDSIVGTQLLIPKGSKLVGAYSSGVNLGQERLMFAFNRLILPSGLNFNLPAAKGLDQSGAAGIEGDVNNHFFKMFASSFFVAWLADKAERNAPAVTTTQQTSGGARTAAGQVLVEVSRSILDRNRSIPTTITVDAGQRIAVQVVRDMEFPPNYIAGVEKR